MLCNCVHGGEYNNYCVLKLYIGGACVYSSISLRCVGDVCMSVFMYMHDCERERESGSERERDCVSL